MSAEMMLRSGVGLTPTKIDKHGPAYSMKDVKAAVVKQIKHEDYFYRSAKMINGDVQKAIELTETMTKHFSHALSVYLEEANKIGVESKRTAGMVKESAERLAQGLARIEKSANLDKLERYTVLLERTAAAMNSLAELEASGKLDKIASALK